MTYCITGLSFSPKHKAILNPIDDKGNDYRPNLDVGGSSGLSGGYILTETTSPSVQEVYRIAKAVSSHNSLPDIFWLGGVLCVDSKFRDIIEAHEEKVHQFLPIKLIKKSGSTFDGDFFILNVCQLLDSIIVEKSDFKIVESRRGELRAIGGLKRLKEITLDRNIIAGHKLWRESIYRRYIFISDAVYESFKKCKLKGIQEHQYVRASEQ